MKFNSLIIRISLYSLIISSSFFAFIGWSNSINISFETKKDGNIIFHLSNNSCCLLLFDTPSISNFEISEVDNNNKSIKTVWGFHSIKSQYISIKRIQYGIIPKGFNEIFGKASKLIPGKKYIVQALGAGSFGKLEFIYSY